MDGSEQVAGLALGQKSVLGLLGNQGVNARGTHEDEGARESREDSGP